MEEAPENGKESSHPAHANGMNEYLLKLCLREVFHIRCYSLIKTCKLAAMQYNNKRQGK
jgi:hypothetical protein